MRLLRSFLLFVKYTAGCVNNPYVTFRTLSDSRTDPVQIIYLLILSVSYLGFASIIRTGIRNPYLMTLKFNSLLLAAGIGFLAAVIVLYILGKSVGGKGSLKTVIVLWSYTLLPTLVWFFFTSIMYVLLPPPRTVSIWGKSYSIFYISLSGMLLGWKLILYYLTLRFGLRLDLGRIILVSLFFFPAVAGYSVLMYRLGVFRIPFL